MCLIPEVLILYLLLQVSHMLLCLQFFDSLFVLPVLNFGDLWSCELVHPTNTAIDLFLVLSLDCLELVLLLLPLLLGIILMYHVIEQLHLPLNFFIGSIFDPLLLLSVECIIKLTYMRIFFHFKLAECYLVRWVVNLEYFLVALSNLLVVLSKFQFPDLEISIRTLHFVETTLEFNHVLMLLLIYLVAYLFLLVVQERPFILIFKL